MFFSLEQNVKSIGKSACSKMQKNMNSVAISDLLTEAAALATIVEHFLLSSRSY